jgi:hypothetical protein
MPVVNIHHNVPYDIYIGRPGKGVPGPLGNPIRPGSACIVCGKIHGMDNALLDCYRFWLIETVRTNQSYRGLAAACHRKALGCFCVDNNGEGLCHGFVLLDVAACLHVLNGKEMADCLTDDDALDWNERTAIRHYDGTQHIQQAEWHAFFDIMLPRIKERDCGW